MVEELHELEMTYQLQKYTQGNLRGRTSSNSVGIVVLALLSCSER
jgi:hypothetical protein